jgi:hypothetical protein
MAAYEDLSGYTEDDAGGYLTIATTKVTWASLPRNVDAYLYKDKTANFFTGDFIHEFKAEFTSSAQGDYGICTSWMIANQTDGIKK